ncbi:MAG: OmpW family outer membrane protein [Betaproteobacteria bacterium]
MAVLSFASHAESLDVSDTWLVRLRALELKPENSNMPGLKDSISINNKVIPEVDVSYALNNNWSAELVLTYPQKHDVRAGGTTIGTVKHLPPSLMLQYRFANDSGVVPYLGAGLNYTRFMQARLPAGITVDKQSMGVAAQLGIDFEIARNTYFNIDYKYITMKTDVMAGGARLTTLELNPSLFGVGIGYRF